MQHKPTILVTGYTGFVGGVLTQALEARGYRLHLAGRSALRREGHFRMGIIDGTTDWRPALEGCSAVVHLMAQVPAPLLERAHYDGINNLSVARLAGQAREAGVTRFIHLSSIFAAVGHSWPSPVTDDIEPQPVSDYGRSKLGGEEHVSDFAGNGRTGIVLRPPMVYGTYGSANWLKLRRLAALPVPLPFGSVNNRRSFIAVENLASAIIHALEGPAQSGVFNVADAEPVSLAQAVRWLREGMGRAPNLAPFPEYVTRTGLKLLGKGDMAQSLFGNLEVDASRFRRLFGWTPPLSPREAMIASGRAARSAA